MATKKKVRKEETIPLSKFKEIIKDPIRILLERLRYDSGNGGDDIIGELKERIRECDYDKRYTVLNVFEYINMLNVSANVLYRNDFIDEIIDRIKNPKPKEKEIIAKRLLHDYLNLDGGDLGILDEALDLVKTKKDKKIIEDYLNDSDEDNDADCDGLGDVLCRLCKKYPLKT